MIKISNTQGCSLAKKTAVVGAVEGKGNIIAKVVGDTTSATIKPFIRENVQINYNIHTDEYRSYKNINKLG